MSYTDMSAVFQYRGLFTHQQADALGENDKVFYDLLTAATDFDNNLRFNNAKYLQGEIAAGATYKKMIGLDASNIVQLGEAGTIVAVPADPSTALGVATKQYVDGVQMYETQPKVSVATGVTGTYATILNLTATTRGRIATIAMLADSVVGGTFSIRMTIDGGTPVVITSTAVGVSKYRSILPNLLWNTTDQATEDLVASLLRITFNTSLLIEATTSGSPGGPTPTCKIVYEKIP